MDEFGFEQLFPLRSVFNSNRDLSGDEIDFGKKNNRQ